MSNYRRYYINGGTWFFTVNLKNRKVIYLSAKLRNYALLFAE
ncbi:hypothetical protein SEEM710_11238 [Salmonella enterica subsp. enterica serovar Montevideo str. ATCC BAA710]|nr:hypothetical protein SEEM710_11238 [Salmonella enterica subsp. enterica serovar Montevideo str. ATCC BAA710]